MKNCIKTGLILFCMIHSSLSLLAQQPEQYRPQYHFTPKKGWMNDPNGLVYYAGEYHLFYQHYPNANVWGPMHWAHAISKDLIHWQDLPIALYPDSLGYIFSGSAVVDENNTAGFQTGTEKTIVAIFTYHNMEFEKQGRGDREYQGIAYSNDKGRTWTKYSGNPVIKNKGDVDFRDPKVFWHVPSKRWCMTLAVGDHVEIFNSPDLKNWTYQSSFGQHEGSHGGVWECPDLFTIKANDGKQKWVLVQNIGRGALNGGSGVQYFVGDFDGKKFTNDNKPETILWFDHGTDNYAGVTWSGLPNGRIVNIGWMSNWDDYAQSVPTSAWRSSNTIPREIKLINTKDGYRIYQLPVKELQSIVDSGAKQRNGETGKRGTGFEFHGKLICKVELVMDLSASANEFSIELKNDMGEKVVIGLNKKKGEVYVDRTKSGKTDFSQKFSAIHHTKYSIGKKLKLLLLLDETSMELFVDDGALAMTEIFFPNKPFNSIHLVDEKKSVVSMQSSVSKIKDLFSKR